MRIDFADPAMRERIAGPRVVPRWGVTSETDILTDVLLCAPDELAPVACCAVTVANLRAGLEPCAPIARAQHDGLGDALAAGGVRVHRVAAMPGMPDLAFARDAGLMSPWGYVQLAPAAAHRRAEAAHVAAAVRALGVPMLSAITEGHVEGGDVCVMRPGLVAIGCSGARTNLAGARSLAAMFERHGWRVTIVPFDPHFLHLDTQFCMLDAHRALACVDVLDDDFLDRLDALGVDLVPVSYKEVQRLGANIVSLGGGRIISTADNARVNDALARLGYDVTALPLDQFTRCGGGPHCLTLPLARVADSH